MLQRRELSKKAFLELFRPDLHFSSLQGVVNSFPINPNHTVVWSFGWKFSMTVRAVKIGSNTSVVPPSPFKVLRTVFGPVVVILIFGWKRVTSMIGQRIHSCSYGQIAKQFSNSWSILNSLADVVNKINKDALCVVRKRNCENIVNRTEISKEKPTYANCLRFPVCIQAFLWGNKGERTILISGL